MAARFSRTNTNLSRVRVHGIGSGGVEELAASIQNDAVQWALLRFEVGSGRFMRVKKIAVIVHGEDTPAVRRGRLIGREPEVIRHMGNFHMQVKVHRGEELTTDFVCQQIQEKFPGDHFAGSNSVADMKSMYKQAKTKLLMRRATTLANMALPEAEEDEEEERVAEASDDMEARAAEEATAAAAAAGEAAKAAEVTLPPELDLLSEEVLPSIAKAWGEYNWALMDPAKGTGLIWNAGGGGLEEMLMWLSDDKVLYGVLRFQFPIMGGKPIVKHIYIHWVGCNLGAVKRGQWNAMNEQCTATIKQFFAVTLEKKAYAKTDLDIPTLIEELKPKAGDMKITLEWYYQGLESEMSWRRQRATSGDDAETGDGLVHGPSQGILLSSEVEVIEEEEPEQAEAVSEAGACMEMPEVAEALHVVGTTHGKWNWVLLTVSRDLGEMGGDGVAPSAGDPRLGAVA